MRWADLPLDPSTRVLRQFAGLWLVFFASLGGWRWFVLADVGTAAALVFLAVIVGPIGLFFPKVLKPVFVGWLAVAFPIGWLVSHAALVVLFYGVMTPVGLFFRLRGRDPLKLRRQLDRGTYWMPKTPKIDQRSYLRQF